MSRASEIGWLVFLQDYGKLKPKDQDDLSRLLIGLVAHAKSDPEAERIAASMIASASATVFTAATTGAIS